MAKVCYISFVRNHQTLFQMAAPLCITIIGKWKFSLLDIRINICHCWGLEFVHSSSCVMGPHNVHYHDTSCNHTLSVYFWWSVSSSLLSIFNLLHLFLHSKCSSYILGNSLLSDMYSAAISLSLWLIFLFSCWCLAELLKFLLTNTTKLLFLFLVEP